VLYLFCNDRYGRAFRDVAISFCVERGLPMTLVYSVKGASPRGKLAASYFRALLFLREMIEGQRAEIRVVLVEDVNSDTFRAGVAPDAVGIIAGFNQIFDPDTIARFDSLVNFHPSLLPLYRGPVPSYWCLQNREARTGYTLYEITEEIDAGRVLFQETVEIREGMDEAALDEAIASYGARTLRRYLKHLTSGKQWTPVVLDAYRIYQTHLEYASFPPQQH
jgi:methionyl-tRNA formyltransferase